MTSPPGRTANLAAYAVAGALGVTVVVMLASIVVARSGNLSWDDASYLAQGINAHRQSRVDRGNTRMLRQLWNAYNTAPKPPFLAIWTSLGTLVVGPKDAVMLALWSSISLYALLYVATFLIARALAGSMGGCLAVVALAASPLSLIFGAKVMVETALSLWILLDLAVAAWFLERPSARRGLVLGTALALTFLTKLTFILFLTFPTTYFAIEYARHRPVNRSMVAVFAAIVMPVIMLAWPWYVQHGLAAFEFARYSAQFDEVTFGKKLDGPRLARASQIVRDIVGYPLAAAVVITLPWKALRTGWRGRRPRSVTNDFVRMTLLGIANGALLLLPPSYFETRFFLPIWPCAAVCLGLVFRQFVSDPPRVKKLAPICGLLTLGLVGSVATLFRLDFPISRSSDERWNILVDHSTDSTWNLAGTLERLIAQHGVKRIGNIGNCSYWNSAKLNLIDILHSSPLHCYVWRDLSALDADELARGAEQCDILLVLDHEAIPPALEEIAPKLNASYSSLAAYLVQSPFRLLERVTTNGPSPVTFSVYVRSGS
jgi:4-amino-4-deoxy-L-arabinose transferase-like glycosyltransferase